MLSLRRTTQLMKNLLVDATAALLSLSHYPRTLFILSALVATRSACCSAATFVDQQCSISRRFKSPSLSNKATSVTMMLPKHQESTDESPTMGRNNNVIARATSGETHGVISLEMNNNKKAASNKESALLPTMIVFDLDDCLWSPEMYTLHAQPSIPEIGDLTPASGRGVIGMMVAPNGPTVRLFSEARKVLFELATRDEYRGIILAAASSSEEPTYSSAVLNGIEVLPGFTIGNMLKYKQIGRTGPLTADKVTHFRRLYEESHIPYEEMLFFDDCNWGDHCARVTSEFGVTSQRTPQGLQYSEFLEGLQKYRTVAENRLHR